jgi:1-deoxy-D-xylulose-5-phosphate synthase
MAAGMAMRGLRPFVTIYSTFLQRAFDAIVHDVALQNLPVVFALDRSGVVGRDGPTHHGLFDLSYLQMIPNMVIMAPKDGAEFRDMIYTALLYEDGPIALRYPRASVEGKSQKGKFDRIAIGKAEVLREGSDAVILAVGKMMQTALKAADLLSREGVKIGVVNLRFVKPLDKDLLRNVAAHYRLIFSLEDNVISGGMGNAVNDALAMMELGQRCINLGFPDKFIEHGTSEELYERYGLSPEQVARRILQTLRSGAQAPEQPKSIKVSRL